MNAERHDFTWIVKTNCNIVLVRAGTFVYCVIAYFAKRFLSTITTAMEMRYFEKQEQLLCLKIC